MNWKIPLSDLDFGSKEENAVLEVLRSRWLTMGEITKSFEEEFAAYLGVNHAVAVSSCTAALHLACVTMNLGPGDEVIVPSLSFVATANAVRYTGATPVFADIVSFDDLTISPFAIEKSVNAKTRGIIVMHYAGNACDMSAIQEVAEKHSLFVIEDNAHGLGASLNGKKLGSLGEIGCFSFFSNKNLVTGEGGMVVTESDRIAENIRRLRSHGMSSLTWDRHKGHASSYNVVGLGYNYRLDEIRSALGRVQLEKLESNNEKRRKLVGYYHERLAMIVPEIWVPFKGHTETSSAHIMSILLPKLVSQKNFSDYLKKRSVQSSMHYQPIHKFQAFEDQKNQINDLPITDEVASRQVTLPLFPTLSFDEVDYVVEASRNAIDANH